MEAAIASDERWASINTPVAFNIAEPWYDAWWFRAIIVLAVVLLSYLGFRLRLGQIKSKEQARTALNRKLAQLEMKALRAQMNPHFTFNTMNSIQNFITNNDTTAAQTYLAKFGRLMRMILEGSREKTIPITISIGATQCLPPHPDTTTLLKNADNLLYKAKNEGRNRVCSND